MYPLLPLDSRQLNPTNKSQAPRLTAFEFTTPSTPQTPKPNSILFVGGLTDGLGTVPYVAPLAKALESTDWSLFWVLLSSSYGGWGVSSLDQDVEEIAQCVQYVQGYKSGSSEAGGKVVVMGHSTGSQDVLHYLHSPNPLPQRKDEFQGRLKHLVRPTLDGVIMQAPMSDREGLLRSLKEVEGTLQETELRAAYDQCVDFAKRQPFTTGDGGQKLNAILPLNLTAKLDFPSDTPLSARRFLSLASPDSPEHPAEDDLFSSDLTDQRLAQTFGVVGDRGLVKGKMMFLYSGNDDYAAPWVNKEALMQRWKEAANAKGVEKYDSEGSAVIPGAAHNVQNEGQGELIARVTRYLSNL